MQAQASYGATLGSQAWGGGSLQPAPGGLSPTQSLSYKQAPQQQGQGVPLQHQQAQQFLQPQQQALPPQQPGMQPQGQQWGAAQPQQAVQQAVQGGQQQQQQQQPAATQGGGGLLGLFRKKPAAQAAQPQAQPQAQPLLAQPLSVQPQGQNMDPQASWNPSQSMGFAPLNQQQQQPPYSPNQTVQTAGQQQQQQLLQGQQPQQLAAGGQQAQAQAQPAQQTGGGFLSRFRKQPPAPSPPPPPPQQQQAMLQQQQGGMPLADGGQQPWQQSEAAMIQQQALQQGNAAAVQGMLSAPVQAAQQAQAQAQAQAQPAKATGGLFSFLGRKKQPPAVQQPMQGQGQQLAPLPDGSLPPPLTAEQMPQQQQQQLGQPPSPPLQQDLSAQQAAPAAAAQQQLSQQQYPTKAQQRPQRMGFWRPRPQAQQQLPPGPPLPTPSGPVAPPPEGIPMVFGPYLRYGGYDPAASTTHLSVLVVAHHLKSQAAPRLMYRDAALALQRPGGDDEAIVSPVLLDSFANFHFWRFDLALQLLQVDRIVEYSIGFSADAVLKFNVPFFFRIPAAGRPWHWGFYAGNGFHNPLHAQELAGIQPMWSDLLSRHQAQPLSVLVSGGDQLFMDDVWNAPQLRAWRSLPDDQARLQAPLTQDMTLQASEFYFYRYLEHYSEPLFSEALAIIPHISTWSDHEIFDGWGTFPPELQQCAVFQGLFAIARRFYLLFQHHTTPLAAAQQSGLFGEFGFSALRLLGPTTAVLALDTRSERFPNQVLTRASYERLQDALQALPPGVRHLVLVSSVPLVFPKLGLQQAMLEHMTGVPLRLGLPELQQKSGLAGMLCDLFGVPLSDEPVESWSSSLLSQEKLFLVQLLQDVATARSVRVSLLSGSANCAGVGRLHSVPPLGLRQDARFMPQIIAGPMANRPAGEGVVAALHAAARAQQLDPVTAEKMVFQFKGGQCLAAQRNWCEVFEQPMAPQLDPAADGSLVFSLRMEHPVFFAERCDVVDVIVPALDIPILYAQPPPPPQLQQLQQVAGGDAVATNRLQPLDAPPSGSPTQQPQYGLAAETGQSPIGDEGQYGLEAERQVHQQSPQPPAASGYGLAAEAAAGGEMAAAGGYGLAAEAATGGDYEYGLAGETAAQEHQQQRPAGGYGLQAEAAEYGAEHDVYAREGGGYDGAEQQKEVGNAEFKKGNYQQAIKFYTAAIEMDGTMVAAYTNRALCWHKLGKFKEAEADCSTALASDPQNVKALLRRAAAREATGRVTHALTDLQSVLRIDPNNVDATAARIRLGVR